MLSVVVPALNEEKGISLTIESIKQTLSKAGISRYQIVVVNDGSKDQTASIARHHGADVVEHVHNLGYGRSLKDGISAARYDTIAIVDADGTYPINLLPVFLNEYNKGYDLIVGRRTGAHYHESWLKRPLRSILKFLVEFTTGQAIPDINSGMRIFSRKTILPYFDQLCNTFSFTTSQTMAYMLTGRFIGYIPIDYHSRIGEKKVKLFRDSLRTLQYIVQSVLYYNPFKLFLLISIGTALAGASGAVTGLCIGSPILSGVGSLGVIASVLIFSLGLLADQMRQILIKIQYRTTDGSVIRGTSIVGKPRRVANLD
jgi:polyisoprenyl-phosphate glycosyltransferase